MSNVIRFERAKVDGVKADYVKHEYTLTLKIPFGLREEVEDELERIAQAAALKDEDQLVRLALEPYQTQLPLMPPASSGPETAAGTAVEESLAEASVKNIRER